MIFITEITPPEPCGASPQAMSPARPDIATQVRVSPGETFRFSMAG